MRLGQLARIARGSDWVISQYLDYAQHRNKHDERIALNKILDIPVKPRIKTWSASGSGGCLRQRQFTWLGFPKKKIDEKTANIFANGDYVHLRHQAFGVVAGYITDTEISVSIPELNLSGTMDGLLTNGAVLEIKSINSFGFSEVNTFGVKPEHKRQVTAYLLAAQKDQAHVIYEDKGGNGLKEFIVHLDNELTDEVLGELRTLNQLTEAQQLAPMLTECQNKEGRYNWCPYAQLCPSAQWPVRRSIQITSSLVSG